MNSNRNGSRALAFFNVSFNRMRSLSKSQWWSWLLLCSYLYLKILCTLHCDKRRNRPTLYWSPISRLHCYSIERKRKKNPCHSCCFFISLCQWFSCLFFFWKTETRSAFFERLRFSSHPFRLLFFFMPLGPDVVLAAVLQVAIRKEYCHVARLVSSSHSGFKASSCHVVPVPRRNT